MGSAPGGLHADGASVNPRGYAWHLMKGNVDASAHAGFKRSWASWREAGAAARGDGCSFDELDVWARFAYRIAERKAGEREEWLGPDGGRRIRWPRRAKLLASLEDWPQLPGFCSAPPANPSTSARWTHKWRPCCSRRCCRSR